MPSPREVAAIIMLPPSSPQSICDMPDAVSLAMKMTAGAFLNIFTKPGVFAILGMTRRKARVTESIREALSTTRISQLWRFIAFAELIPQLSMTSRVSLDTGLDL